MGHAENQVESVEERYIREYLAILRNRYEEAVTPYITRLAAIRSMRVEPIYIPKKLFKDHAEQPQFMGFDVVVDPKMAPNEMKLVQAQKQAQEPVPVATQWLAEMIMSDCGCSTNNQRLLDRIIDRIDQYERANAAPKQAEPVQINLEQVVRNELNEAMRPHAEAIDREVFAKASQPEGYKLVPVEPTPEMCAAGAAYMNAPVKLISKNAVSFYSAMLAAAPEAQ